MQIDYHVVIVFSNDLFGYGFCGRYKGTGSIESPYGSTNRCSGGIIRSNRPDAVGRTEALCQGITEIATDLGVAAILCSTTSGELPGGLARMQPALPVDGARARGGRIVQTVAIAAGAAERTPGGTTAFRIETV
ncbi:MAG: hypothetical protein H7145_07965 [Akkermansiaceae bacterium]|nr:hypothetical protein [Armatimonadota bacterium]